MLKMIFEEKKKLGRPHPRIIIHNVIFSLNYKDIEEMLNFALEAGADAIQFVPMDPVKAKTETLLLSDQERKELLERLHIIEQRYDAKTFRYTLDDGRYIVLSDFDGFIRRTAKLDTLSGSYDEDVVDVFPCYVGWLFTRIMTTGNVVPCCKGHRMQMGNIYKNRFKDIWFSQVYNEFRNNDLNLSKQDAYFSRIGNDAVERTGCYNCDNLWQNIPMHNKILLLKDKNSNLSSFCSTVLKNLF